MPEKTLIVIPARGGSKGIPRKNLRPLLGQPLISYSIKAALGAKAASTPRVVVTTDDDEIELFSLRYGAEVIRRSGELAADSTPLDPVIIHAVKECEARWGERYAVIITVQPTSPLITSAEIDSAIATLASNGTDTILSVTDDRHLRWVETKDGLAPEYTARVNRQLLPAAFRETGAIIGCKRHVIDTGTRISGNVSIFLVDKDKSIDIDTYNDLWLCENILSRKKIVITVIGSSKTGLGHAFRALLVAHELTRHEVVFLCCEQDCLAIEAISRQNYRVETCPDGKRLESVLALKPDMVINDILDTNADYIVALRKAGVLTVNFEHMGLGAEVADLAINALYPHQVPNPRILVGPKYFCLRDEFLNAPEREPEGEVKRVILLFGGVDEADLTGRTLKVVGPELLKAGIEADIILGLGYQHRDSLDRLIKEKGFTNVTVISSTPRISDYMSKADLAITSAGRTVFELASLRVPMVVICQNLRETTHTFANSENGIINLGIRHELKDEDLSGMVKKILVDNGLRKMMRERLEKIDLRGGKRQVMGRIMELLERRSNP